MIQKQTINWMQASAFSWLVFLFLCCTALMQNAVAQDAITAAKIINVSNPHPSHHIQIGELLTRQVELQIQSPYQLSTEALPMKGARKDGMELRNIDIKKTEIQKSDTEKTDPQKSPGQHYVITLQYQVFAAHFEPAILQLPAEKFAITGGPQALTVNLPAWKFWFSPLVPKNISHTKDNMQPQLQPTLIDLSGRHVRFWLAVTALVIGLAGLIYVNADKRWLPFMNGAFASAHRNIKKLPKNSGAEKQALAYVHQAFNQTNGANLFVDELDAFLNQHPVFTKYETQIMAFFECSNQSLFGDNHAESGALIDDLLVLSRQLRHVERGV